MGSWLRCAAADLLRFGIHVFPWLAWTLFAVAAYWASWRVAVEDGSNGPLALTTVLLLGVVATRVIQARARRQRRPTEGANLPADQHPALWAAVAQACEFGGVRQPTAIYLGLEPTEVGRVIRVGARRRCVLDLGVAQMCSLSVGEWQAALLQTLGTGEVGPAWERRVVRGQHWMVRRASIPREFKWLGWSAERAARLHTRLAEPICKLRQVHADEASAALTSPADAQHAIVQLESTRVAWLQFWELHVEPAGEILRRPLDIVGGFRAYLRAVGPPELPPSFSALPSSVDAFMSQEARLVRLGEAAMPPSSPLRGPIGPVAVGSAVDLLGEPGALADLEIAWFADIGLTPLGWDELAHALGYRQSRERSAQLLDEWASSGQFPALGALIDDALTNQARALRQLFREGSDAEDDPDPEELWWAGCLVGDAVAAALVDTRAARYVVNWTGQASLVDADGQILDPWSAVASAVVEPRNSDDVRRWLDDLGIPDAYLPTPLGPGLERSVMDADPVRLCSACLYTDWIVRFLFILDTGLVVMKPRASDYAIAGVVYVGGNAGSTLLQRRAKLSGTALMSAKKARYLDWSDIRSATLTIRSRQRIRLDIQGVGGQKITLRGNRESRYDGDLEWHLAHFLTDRLTVTRDP